MAVRPSCDRIAGSAFSRPVLTESTRALAIGRTVSDLGGPVERLSGPPTGRRLPLISQVFPRPARHGYFLRSGACSVDSAATNASWGTSTRPMVFIRRLPSFCFSSSLRLRVMSPP